MLFVKNASESISVTKRIAEMRKKYADSEVIFIDCGRTPLGDDKFEEWVTNMATSTYYAGKDNNQSTQYLRYATSILAEWRSRIKHGQFVLYTKVNTAGEVFNSMEALGDELRTFDKKRFPLALECNYKSAANWWAANSLGTGVECGVKQEIKSTYKSKNARLEEMLSNALDNPNYWTDYPADCISRVKTDLNEFVGGIMEKEGRISILSIYDFLKGEPYGYLPCNMTAFFMGFLLKEYVMINTLGVMACQVIICHWAK